jgi:UDP-N-acetylglucosamine--dolichyl-phosphate N-acetylglucosaminephosphotransferase
VALAAVCQVQQLSAPIAVNVALSICGGLIVLKAVPAFSNLFLAAGLKGIDLSKKTTLRSPVGELVRPVEGIPVPEAMGVVAGAVFIVVMSFFLPFACLDFYRREGTTRDVELALSRKLLEFISGLLSIVCMCFLGFADNVLNLRWRDKLFLPLAATLPLLLVYYANGGSTSVLLPFGDRVGAVDIGPLYYAFLAALGIFCTNAINILAGVNGLEVGQSVVIAFSIVVNNCVQLARIPSEEVEARDNQLFSLYLVVPFIGTACALLVHNWYPAQCFVGDTFCYFAGMTFAVVGILGHFSKTLLLFFIPQVFNFLFSIPQLFKWVPCPRHRMPGYDPKQDKLINSYAELDRGELSKLGRLSLAVAQALRLVDVQPGSKPSTLRVSNFTLINVVLHWLGPMHEANVTKVLMLLQVACSAFGFFLRYRVAYIFYDVVN